MKEKVKVLEGRIFYPTTNKYHVTVWYSDGSKDEFFQPAYDVYLKPPMNFE